MNDATGGDELTNCSALRMLREQLVREAEGSFRDAARKQLAKTEEVLLQQLIFDEVDAVEIGWEERLKFFAAAGVDDEVNVDLAGAQQAEVVVGQDGLAAEARGGVFGGDEDAKWRHADLAPKTR